MHILFFEKNDLKHLGKKLWFFLTQKLLIVNISQKLRIAQQKSLMRKMSVRSIPIYPTNLVNFEESLILYIRSWDRAEKRCVEIFRVGCQLVSSK